MDAQKEDLLLHKRKRQYERRTGIIIPDKVFECIVIEAKADACLIEDSDESAEDFEGYLELSLGKHIREIISANAAMNPRKASMSRGVYQKCLLDRMSKCEFVEVRAVNASDGSTTHDWASIVLDWNQRHPKKQIHRPHTLKRQYAAWRHEWEAAKDAIRRAHAAYVERSRPLGEQFLGFVRSLLNSDSYFKKNASSMGSVSESYTDSLISAWNDSAKHMSPFERERYRAEVFRIEVKPVLDYERRGILACFVYKRVNKVRRGTCDWESTLKEWNDRPDIPPEWRYLSVADMLADFRRFEEKLWGENITALPE